VRRNALALIVTVSITLVAVEVFAAGYYLPGRGVRPLGRAGAFVASGEGNLNSLWYNPANLTLTEGMQLTIDTAMVNHGFDFHRAPRTTRNGDTVTYDPVSNEGGPEIIPQVLVGGPTGVDDMSWAFGLYTPYMSTTTFPERGGQRYTLIDNSGSAIVFLHGALSYEIADGVRVGGGIQNAIASLRMVSIVSGYSGAFGRPEDEDLDILTKFELRDWFSPAANVGVWVELGPAVEAAISAQSPFFIRDEEAKLTVRLPEHPKFDGASLSNDTVQSGLALPPVIRVALRLVADPVDVELAAVWEGWSIFEELEATPNNIRVDDISGVGSIQTGPLTLPQNYEDTYSLRLGGDLHLSDTWTARAGYAFETGAPPDSYYSVFLADSNKHIIAGGASWEVDQWTLDFSTAMYVLQDRHVTDSRVHQVNPIDADDELTIVVGNGDYAAHYLIAGMGVNYHFE
jgi:long-chain fatty acid transport protein